MEPTQNEDIPNGSLREKPKEKEKRSRALLYVIAILALLLLILVWQLWRESETINEKIKDVRSETAKSDSVTKDLITLQGQYALLKTDDKDLQDKLENKKDSITLLMQQAQKYKNDPYIIAQLKKETNTLRSIMQSFVHTIDSLNTLNVALKNQNAAVSDSLKVEKNTAASLKKEKKELQSKISTGSLLDANNVNAEGVFFRFGKKEVSTEKAHKTQKLKVTYTLSANRIAANGDKIVYIRVISPDAQELSATGDETSVFSFEGNKGYYSGKQTINYSNQQMTISSYCESNKGFIEGKYVIKLYCDGAEIGQTAVTLK